MEIKIPSHQVIVRKGAESIHTVFLEGCVDGLPKKDSGAAEGSLDAAIAAFNRISGRQLRLVKLNQRTYSNGHRVVSRTNVVLEEENRFYEGKGLAEEPYDSLFCACVNAVSGDYSPRFF
ncbi:hypothetical protein HYS31_03740 [Candidatus Woesearchaeota archaeon]|nr:hypothetical protein [Candidatus Woesearchaeota archaeon]